MTPEEQSIRPELSSVRPELSSVGPELSSVGPELVSVRPELVSVRPEPVEGHSADAECLASGFAEHVVRWARRMQEDAATTGSAPFTESDLSILRRCAHEVSLATSNGNVCLMLSELTLPPSTSGEGQGSGPLPDVTTLRTILSNSGVVGTPAHAGSLPLILDEDGRLYLHRYFDYEVRLARRLTQAASTPPRAVDAATRDLLNSLFPPTTGNEVDWQKIAAAMALRNGLTVISGGPGTGKTTTVVNLLACLLTQEPGTRVALAAPTGKAAARMTEAIRQRAEHLPGSLRAKLPAESFTIHRLLGANPGLGKFTYHAGNPLPYDVLIVDEASMLDLAMATRLLEAVPLSARIILLGDKDQLAAVEAGAVFAELSADPTLTDACRGDLAAMCGLETAHVEAPAALEPSALRDAAVWLTKNYRFGADSGIGRLAADINMGRAQDAMGWLRSASSGSSSTQPSSSSSVARGGKRGKGAQLQAASLPLFPGLGEELLSTSDPETSVKWLEPGPDDVQPVDAVIAGYGPYFRAVSADPRDVAAISRAFSSFRVLCAVRQGPAGVTDVNERLTRHARDTLKPANAPGHDGRSPWYVGRPVMVLHNDYVHKLFNGDIGIALPDAAGELTVFFPDGDQGYRAVPPVRMPAHETAFAMTVHKAQGSECDGVLVLLPQQRSRVLTRELLYTALTRARSRVTVSATAEVLAAAIESRSRRHSGLLARLRESGVPQSVVQASNG